MPGPIVEKIQLWRQSDTGIKTRLSGELESPTVDRDDLSPLLVDRKLERGDRLQKLRLRYYPSINVERDNLYAGHINGDLSDAEDLLMELGFRNNPTAYVEVTEENGPDDGSYSRQFITETGSRFDIPKVVKNPSFYKRMKRQIHITVYDIEGKVEFLAHDERSAWLQPARHIAKGDVKARVGVRDFRDLWYDEFGKELRGKEQVKWDTTH